MEPDSFAVPDQIARPELDAAFRELERQSDSGTCGQCGRADYRKIKFGGRAFWDPSTQKMTPWMCPECAAAYEKTLPTEREAGRKEEVDP